MAFEENPHEHLEAPTILEHVPVGLRIAGAYSWRIVVVGIVTIALTTVIGTLAPIVIPIAIAVLMAAPLNEVVNFLERRGMRRSGAALLSILTLLTLVIGLLTAAGQSIVSGFDNLRDRALDGLGELLDWLAESPIHVSREQLQGYIDNAESTISDNSAGLVSGALSVTSTVGTIGAGIFIGLFCLFFFLRDGRAMWLWTVSLFPKQARYRVDIAGRAGWTTLGKYANTQVFVAAVDAIGIGVGAWILGVPLALPLGILVFLGSFIPIMGATITGVVAVLVALVDQGWVTALLMLGVVMVVQQLEGNILYPWLFGRAVSLHPVAILLTVASGTLVAGFIGALLAVPVLAFCYNFIQGLKGHEVAPVTGEMPLVVKRAAEIAKHSPVTKKIRVRKKKEK